MYTCPKVDAWGRKLQDVVGLTTEILDGKIRAATQIDASRYRKNQLHGKVIYTYSLSEDKFTCLY